MKTKDELKQHEETYWHIKKFAILPLLGLILFAYLSYLNFGLIDKQVIKEAFNCEKDNCNLSTKDLINIYPLIGEYILINLGIISLVAFFKRGYNNLKKYKEEGLIGGLIGGLIWGLIGGLIWGLIGEFEK
jgi:hypothetical protein